MIGFYARIGRVNSFFRNTNCLVFILIITTILYVSSVLLNVTVTLVGIEDVVWFEAPSEKKYGFAVLVILALILAPVIETLVSQVFVYKVLTRFFFLAQRKWLIVVISGFVFGIFHYYSLLYVFHGFLLGVVFMYAYVVRLNTDKRPYLVVMAIHFLCNLISILIQTVGVLT